jgi:hypothetical protein
MKYVIVIVVVVVVLVFWMMKPQNTSAGSQGILSDVPRYIEALLKSDDPHAFLIITHDSSGDFLQFTATENIVQMDFPLITEQQKSKAEKLKTTCSSLGLVLEENTGTDGSKFFDWNLSGTPEEMFKIIAPVFIQAFGAKADDAIEFQHDGLTI